MNRVLIITYYWPPSGGSAVLRWLKFTKYLSEFGWEPVIYTPSNPEPQEIDHSLLQDIPPRIKIIKTRIYEPYSLYKWLTGKKQKDLLGVALMSEKKKPGLISKLSLWIRSNFFIPDPRMMWIRPSVRYLTQYIKQNPVDAIITTGPPHSMHLIGLALKKKLGIRWIADFRDPWTKIDFYNELKLTRLADNIHHQLERKVLHGADTVITVSPGMTQDFKSMGIANVFTITNGYDEQPLSAVKIQSNKFTIMHLGSLPKSRNPENLWKVLSDLILFNKPLAEKLEIKLIGKADQMITDSLAMHGLERYIKQEAFIPHKQTLKVLTESSVLLLCINNTHNAKGILTNKFFEYLSAKRPILAIGPVKGDAAAILNETGAGKMFEYNDLAGLKEHVSSLFNLYSQNNLKVDSHNIEKFSRKNLTGELVKIMNALVNP